MPSSFLLALLLSSSARTSSIFSSGCSKKRALPLMICWFTSTAFSTTIDPAFIPVVMASRPIDAARSKYCAMAVEQAGQRQDQGGHGKALGREGETRSDLGQFSPEFVRDSRRACAVYAPAFVVG